MNRLISTLLMSAIAFASSGHAQVSELHSLTFANPERLGLQADGSTMPTCCQPQLSQDGRFVLFVTNAVNLVNADHNNNSDLFVRDRVLGSTARANVRSDGQQGRSGGSVSAIQGAISADGDWVAFSSEQSDLVANDSNMRADVFLHQRSTSITTRILGSGGVQPNSTTLEPSVSGNGRFIVFSSSATNMLPGTTAGQQHVFLLDQTGGNLEQIDVTPAGLSSAFFAQAPGVSDDGRFVIFKSNASDLVAAGGNEQSQVFLRDRQLGLTRRLSESGGAPADLLGADAMISGDGSRAVFSANFSGSLIFEVFAVDVSTGVLSRVSVDNANNPGTRDSYAPSISRNGQRVAFTSRSALATGGVDDRELAYVRDLGLQTTSLVFPSNTDVAQSDPHISGDGQVVSVLSFSNTLVGGDTNSVQDQFVRDLSSNQTSRVSLADASGPFPSRSDGDSVLSGRGTRQLSADGRYLATATTAHNLGNGVAGTGSQIAHIDRQGNVVQSVSRPVDGAAPNGAAFEPAISADGRFVVFRSNSTNLITGDNNNAFDVFWRDMDNNALERVNLGPGNIQAVGAAGVSVSFPTVSDDGNLIAYASIFTNLVTGDTNGRRDIFVRDRATASTTRVSVDSVGTESNGNSDTPVISADGRYVVYTTLATNLVASDTGALQKIIRHDRQSGATELVSVGLGASVANGNSYVSAISADGSLIAFSSSASNLVSGDSNARDDIFLRDMLSGTTTRVSVDSLGVQGNGNSSDPSISADGRYVSFFANSSNLVPGDTNLRNDVFLHDRQTGQTTRVSVDPAGRQLTTNFEANQGGQLTPDGSHVAIDTSAVSFDLLTGVASSHRNILLATPALTPPPTSAEFADGFE